MANNLGARAVGIAAAVTVLLAALVSWFAWPAKALEPRDLPVVVSGPAPVAAMVTQQLDKARPGGFEVTTVPDAAAADEALRNREAYAAFVLDGGTLTIHTASGASPTVAALVGQAATQLINGGPVPIVDVVPGAPDDPRGAGFASGYLPLVLASMVAGILLAMAIPVWTARLLGLGTYAVIAGLAGAAVLHGLGVITGSYLAAAGVLALLALAVGGTVLGLAAVLGGPGIGLGVLLVFLFGNPISAVAAAPELLPQPWGMVGQWLPAGAGATLLRSAVFFDWAGSAASLLTLAIWAAVGVSLTAIGRTPVTGHSRTPAATAPTANEAVAA